MKNRSNIDKKSIKTSIKNQTKINQNQPKSDEKSNKNRGLGGSGAALEASWAGLGDPRRLENQLGPSWTRLGGLLGGLRPRKVANMGPTWLPKRSKIAPKTPWIAQAGPRRLQSCPGASQTSIFGRFLVDIG